MRNSKRLDELTGALLDYATVDQEAGKLEAVALEQVLSEVRADLDPLITRSDADLSWENLPVVLANRVGILRVLQNLIANAIKYGRPGVRPVVRVSAKRLDGQWQIDVADNGRGITPEHLETVFAPLKRLHSSDVSGSGLGLAICKRIVEGEDGRIWVDSKLGVGSVFHFTVKGV